MNKCFTASVTASFFKPLFDAFAFLSSFLVYNVIIPPTWKTKEHISSLLAGESSWTDLPSPLSLLSRLTWTPACTGSFYNLPVPPSCWPPYNWRYIQFHHFTHRSSKEETSFVLQLPKLWTAAQILANKYTLAHHIIFRNPWAVFFFFNG